MKAGFMPSPGTILRVRRTPFYRALMFDADGMPVRRLADGELVTVLQYINRKPRSSNHLAVIASDGSVGLLWWEREAFEATE
jgi:hypothetical protein